MLFNFHRTANAAKTSCGGCCTRLVNFGVRLNGVAILEAINLHVHCGELTVLLGPNGAGKTTLFRAMLGELPYSGQLQFIHAESEERFIHPRIGYVPQKLDIDALAPVTVMDLLTGALAQRPVWLGHSRALRAQAGKMLAAVKAQDLLDQRIGQLSCGQLQRTLLALALMPVPDLLLLDEPVSGVDPAGIDLFYHMVSELRRMYDLSILLVSHDIPTAARFADRMVFLNRTILCDGTPREVLAGPCIRQTFGVDLANVGLSQIENQAARVCQHETCENQTGCRP
ncbi:MAG: metal ABC transporter ATP-binding protein [Lentisphaerae bacterium]|nr:metal ABC transporter ATP-binding protein [Lentisphaerota bacterium]